jgi:hypothetical protein
MSMRFPREEAFVDLAHHVWAGMLAASYCQVRQDRAISAGTPAMPGNLIFPIIYARDRIGKRWLL